MDLLVELVTKALPSTVPSSLTLFMGEMLGRRLDVYTALIVVITSIVLITKITTDFRIEQPIAVLLTLIFLQDGYRQPLPPLNYLTYLDKIYAIAYLLTFVSFGLNVFVRK